MLYNRHSFRNYVTFPFRKWRGGPAYKGKSIQQIRNMNDGPECPLAEVYSASQARKLFSSFEDHRFTINKLSYKEFFLYQPRLAFLSRYLGKASGSFLARHWGWNLYIRARKPRESN